MAEFKCYVGKNFAGKDSIRKSVCRDLEKAGEIDGHEYCLLHLPSKDKDVERFEKIINGRVKEDELSKISYDFRGVWFPVDVKFTNKKLNVSANFRYTTFTKTAGFSNATFTQKADFWNAKFTRKADFSNATFTQYANFWNLEVEKSTRILFQKHDYNQAGL